MPICMECNYKFKFAKMTTDRKFDIFVTKASISLS